MVDLSIIYSKTGKGLRARNAADAGLSAKQLKLLAFIDGKSKASKILSQSNTFTEKELAAALNLLETNGFIRPLAATQSNAEDWALTSNFTPMVVEEFKSEDDIEATALAKAVQQKQDAELIAAAKANEKIRWQAEINARKVAEAKQKSEDKAKTAAQEKSRLAQEHIARKTALAQINETKLEAMRKAKAALVVQQEVQQKAHQKAHQKAELAKVTDEQALIKKIEKEAADAAAKEAARLEMARIVRKAEEERMQLEIQAKEARQEAKRKVRVAEQASVKVARKVKDDAEQARIDAAALEQNKIVLQQAVQIEMDRFTRDAENENNRVNLAENNAQVLQIAEADQAILLAAPLADKITGQHTALHTEEERQVTIQQNNSAEQETQAQIEQIVAARQAQEKAEMIRAKNEANEQAFLAEKELARQEMARIAREADALRSQADNPYLPKPTKGRRFEASQGTHLKSAKLKKSTIQADKNANLADARVKEAQKRAYIAISEQQHAAKNQAEIKAPIKTKRTPIDLKSILLSCVKWLVKLVKTTLVIGVLLALLLIGLLHFVNISPLIAPIEKWTADNLGSPVHIVQVRASLWPQPHLVLGNVTIGDLNSGNTLEATSMQVIPDALSLFGDVKRVKSLQIQGLVIEQSNIQQSLQLIQQIGKAPSLKIEQLNVSDLRFKVNDLVLVPFDGKLALNAAGELNSLDLHSIDGTLKALIKRSFANRPVANLPDAIQDKNYAIALTGTKWPLPLNPNIVFDELKANAVIHQNQMNFSQIEGAMFGGNISAKAVLNWANGWHTTASFTLTNANVPQLLKAFASKASIDGKVRITGDFASQSAEALKLINTPTISASIALNNGKINGVDLAHAVMFNQNTSLLGDATAFEQLTANLQVKDGQYHYKKILLNTKQFHANGNVDIGQNQAISGRINATVNAQSRRLQADFNLGGTIDNVKRQ